LAVVICRKCPAVKILRNLSNAHCEFSVEPVHLYDVLANKRTACVLSIVILFNGRRNHVSRVGRFTLGSTEDRCSCRRMRRRCIVRGAVMDVFISSE